MGGGGIKILQTPYCANFRAALLTALFAKFSLLVIFTLFALNEQCKLCTAFTIRAPYTLCTLFTLSKVKWAILLLLNLSYLSTDAPLPNDSKILSKCPLGQHCKNENRTNSSICPSFLFGLDV